MDLSYFLEIGMKKENILNILSNKRVLYAEDEEDIRQNVTEILELFFEDVVAVGDGKEALEQMELSSFDVLMFDVCMPNLDGLEAIKKIRQKDKKVPIIILSAHAEQEYLWRAVELKITKYLTKPYSKDELIDSFCKVALELVDYILDVKIDPFYSYDPCKKVIIHGNKSIKLSNKESRLLEYLIKRANQSVSFEDIYEYLWEFDVPSKEAIKSIVKELRRKMGKDSIKNIYGIGYTLELSKDK